MRFLRRQQGDPNLPASDRGTGSLDDYRYDLLPKNGRVRMRLADSQPHQDELRTIADSGETELATAFSARSIEQERVDAPIEVRLFTGKRVSGVVGVVPRGLESIVDETVRRLDDRGDKPRIPAAVVSTRNGLRVELLMGETR